MVPMTKLGKMSCFTLCAPAVHLELCSTGSVQERDPSGLAVKCLKGKRVAAHGLFGETRWLNVL